MSDDHNDAVRWVVQNAPDVLSEFIRRSNEANLAALPRDFAILALSAFADGIAAWAFAQVDIPEDNPGLQQMRAIMGCAGWDYAEAVSQQPTEPLH